MVESANQWNEQTADIIGVVEKSLSVYLKWQTQHYIYSASSAFQMFYIYNVIAWLFNVVFCLSNLLYTCLLSIFLVFEAIFINVR